MNCKISIIVPVYKVEKYLENCIRSILNQTFKDFELILVDDGSPDKCGLICDKYTKEDSRIKVIHKENEGLSSARNSGIEIARGEYITFVDSDDYINKFMYEIMYNTADKSKSDIVICDYKNVYHYEVNASIIVNYQNKVENLTNIQVLNRLYEADCITYIVAWNKLYKRELFEGIRYDKGRTHEDEFIIHKLLYRSNIITYIPEKLYYYMQRSDSIMAKRNYRNKLDKLAAIKERLEFMYNYNLDYLIMKTSQKYIYHFFKIYYDIKNNYENSKYILLSMRKDYEKVLKIILKNGDCYWKEKILLIAFAINPYLYELYTKKGCNRC